MLTRRGFLCTAGLLGVAATACAREQPVSGPVGEDGAGPLDAVVIGAGVAGLAAARVLADAGRSHLVLEARDRLGGRIWTSTAWSGGPVDLGASWVHGTDGNPVYDEIVRFGLPTAVFDVGSADGAGSSVLYSAAGASLDDDAVAAGVSTVVTALEEQAAQAPSEPVAAALARVPAAARAALRNPAVAAAVTGYIADYGATPEQLASAALEEQDSLPGAQRVLPGGYGQFIDRLAEGVPVRTATAVTEISLRDPTRVVVRARGAEFSARRVILTVPLGVLKAGGIRVDLPAGHRRAIEALGMGRYEKLALAFEEPFWDDVDEIAIAVEPGAPFGGWYNLHRVTGRPVLMALNGAAAAVALDGLPAGRQAALAGEVLRGVYRNRYREPAAVAASGWWRDEFSRGSYSFTAAGAGQDARAALAEPVDDRLWVAGEAVHPDWHSTVHGAWASGRAAAEQVCGR